MTMWSSIQKAHSEICPPKKVTFHSTDLLYDGIDNQGVFQNMLTNTSIEHNS